MELSLRGLVCVSIAAIAVSAWAVPAQRLSYEILQPDGTRFNLVLCGDEFFSWHETDDGYVVVMDGEDGFWKYAQPATDCVAFVAIPTARVGSCDPAKLGLGKHAKPDAERLKEFIERHRKDLVGEPEVLPAPEGVTNTNLKQGDP